MYILSEMECQRMNKDHSQHCHCNCNDLFDLQEAIEKALAIHIRPEPKNDCLMCNTNYGGCNNCKWVKNCIVCAELWPCDTFMALDINNE